MNSMPFQTGCVKNADMTVTMIFVKCPAGQTEALLISYRQRTNRWRVHDFYREWHGFARRATPAGAVVYSSRRTACRLAPTKPCHPQIVHSQAGGALETAQDCATAGLGCARQTALAGRLCRQTGSEIVCYCSPAGPRTSSGCNESINRLRSNTRSIG